MTAKAWLFGYLRPQRSRLLLSLLLYVATGVALIGNTSIQKWVIDDVFFGGRYELLGWLLLLMTIGAVVANACHAAAGLMMSVNGMKLRQELSNDYKHKLSETPADKIVNGRTGDITHTFMQELPAVARFATHYIPELIRHGVQVIVLAIIIGVASPWLLAALTGFSVVYIMLGKKSIPRIKEITKEKQQHHASYTVQLEEGIASTREVVAFHRQAWEKKRLESKFLQYFHKVMEELRWKNKQLFITEPIQWLPTIFVLGYGGYAVIHQQMSLGLFIIVFQFAQQYMESVGRSYHQIVGISQQMTMVERVYGKYQIESIHQDEDTELSGSISSVRFVGTSFSYGSGLPRVLDDFELELPIRKKVAIVGSSGSGKSTLAKLLVKNYVPTAGDILVNSIPLSSIQSADWYSRISYVPQEPYLLPDTIESNIRFGREDISHEELRNACEIAQIIDWIDTLPEGFGTLCGERGIQLSGGQRQRIAIARAILEQREILILDEATSALDQETEYRLQLGLDLLRKEKTTIIIAHRLSTILNSDTILVMDQGKVAAHGTHDELIMRSSVYRELQHIDEFDRHTS